MLKTRVGLGVHALLIVGAAALAVVAALDHRWLTVVSASLTCTSLVLSFLAHHRALRAGAGADRVS